MKRKLIGWLGSCSTPYCGAVYGYFCVRCRHFVETCACGDSGDGCPCPDRKGWAGKGERRQVSLQLAERRATP